MRNKLTKYSAILLAAIAFIGCSQRKDSNTDIEKGDSIESAAPMSSTDSTAKVSNTNNSGIQDSVVAKKYNQTKKLNKQLADLKRRTISKYFANCDSDTLTVGRARLAVPSGAMTRPRVLSITPLKKGEIAQLPAGMVNVTGDCGTLMAATDTVAGYRFLPHGNHFSNHLASITVPYDSTLIPKGYTVDDIHTYYYDEMKHQWTMLKSAGVDKEHEVAMAETSHFTDVINGIIKVPESPETQNYVPTGIKDLKAADPNAGIQQIEAPTPNQNGTANISYLFETPGGRNDIAASAGLQYSSDGGSSYVGYGWSLPVTSIDIETRWGVPRFNKETESESYLLMGQQLNNRTYRQKDEKRRDKDKRFYPTIEGSFNKIIRRGDSPDSYYWEVTAKDGTVYSYGGYGNVDEESVIRDANNNIVKWALMRITDVHGNFAAFHYQKSGGNLYPSKYTWTGFNEDEGLFSIEFDIDLESEQRIDVTKNGRLGLLQTDAALLKKVIVRNDGRQLRAYKPNYETGPFGKTLLKSMDQLDSEDNLVASQSFDYYNDVENGLFGEPQVFTSAKDDQEQQWAFFKHKIDDCDDELSILGGGQSSGKTVGGGMMVGFGLGVGTMNVGASYSHSKNEGVGRIALTDIDGDGLPDKVLKTSSGLRYCKNLAAQGKLEFAESRPISGISDFSRSVSTSDVSSADAAVEAYIASAGISYTNTTDQDKTKVYFSDFNGDGLVDIAKNGVVYFNHSDGDNVSFSPSSRGTSNEIISGKEIELDDAFKVDYEELRKSLESQFPLHDVVRVWRAPYNGNISLTSSIQKTDAQGDGVEYSIQKEKDEPLKKEKIEGTDTTKIEDSFNLAVKAGDRIFFRLHAIYSGIGDEVNWHPVIKYTDKVILKDTISNYLNCDNFEYDIEKDYIPGVSYTTRFDKTGTVVIKAPYAKEATYDNVKLVVTKRTTKGEYVLDSIVLNANDTVSGIWEKTLNVSEKDSTTIFYTIETGAPIDWHKVDWQPNCVYTYTSNNKEIVDESNLVPLPMMYNKPIRVSKDYVKSAKILKESETYKPYVWIYPNLKVSRESGDDKDTAIVHLVLNNENGKHIYSKNLVLEKNNQLRKDSILLEKETAKLLLEGKARATFSIQNELSSVSDASLHFRKDTIEFIKNAEGNVIATKIHQVAVDTLSAFVYSDFNTSDFGMLYRGWGQFAYNGNGDYGKNKIDVNELKNRNEDYKRIAKEYQKSKDRKKLEELSDVNRLRFFTMGFNQNRNEYVSATDSAFIGRIKMCPSRLGTTAIEIDSVDAIGEDGLSAPVLITRSSGDGYGVDGAIAFAGVSGSHNSTQTYTTIGAMDMNGDSYPDWFEEKDDDILIQYTKSTGVLSDQKSVMGLQCPMSESESSSIGASLTLSKNDGNANGAITVNICPKTRANQTDSNESGNNNSNNAENASSGNIISSVAVSASGNFSHGNSYSVREWQDINGDGLPDMVIGDKVKYNLGYSFSDEMDRGTSLATSSFTKNWGAGLGTKIGVLGTAFTSFGFNGTVSTNLNQTTYLDINGDGLPDVLSYDQDNNADVLINTGSGYKFISKSDNIDLGSSKSSSISVYGDVAVKICFHILFAKFALTPSVKYSTSDGVNRTTTAIMDVDGDGLPDLVESNNTDELIVRSNLTGRTNKLKSVTLPFGGRFNIAYEQTQPSFEHPGRQWVMSSVESIGGYKENGAVASKNSFEYEGGYRDRKERDFFGFRTVRTNQLDTENDDKIYRYSVQTYADNHDYYRHALVTSEALFTADGNKLQESLYTYSLKAQKDTTVVFPQLTALVQNTYVEGCDDALSTLVENTYDEYGNLLSYKETVADVVLDADIKYHNKSDKYIVSVPESITVKSNGVTYRQRSTKIDGNGEIISITMHNGDMPSVFGMEYDDYGNIVKATKPENYRGQKMFHEYTYDDKYHSLLMSVKDAFGYSSSTTYDDLWLAPLTTTDLNKVEMQYTYDALGRPATIRAPYEIESGQPFTIKYEYDPANRLAHTIHYSQDGNIDTYTFADSLMRAVQTKVTGVVWNGSSNEKVSIVSGRAVIDAFGRNVAAYYPVQESFGSIAQYNSATGDLVSTTQYDSQDRPVEVKLADGATTRSEYAIVNRDGESMLETKVIDALNHHAESYTDAKQRNRETVQHSDDGEVVVKYDYDPVGQVLAVHHPNGSTTTYEYDLLGQKLKVNHPDAGEVECTYDAAGNLIKKLTAQIKKTISAESGITYTYDYNRLKEVLYPENLFNRVTYTYGEPDDEYGRAGRLTLVEDASGGEAYYYGKMGEVTKTVRTVMASLADIRTYIYGATYDSWNRVRTMTYPDGEVVTYHYNAAGQIESLSSNKLGRESVIVDKIGYDKDGHTVYTKLGNGTETTYSYDKQRERLQSMLIKSGSDSIMANQYTYDAVDNILSIANSASGKSGLGGKSTHNYTYDMLNRLSSASGSAKDIKYTMSMTLGKMSEPLTKVQSVDSTSVAKSYNLAYKYEDALHPTAPTQIGNEHYTYDANGNPILVENDSTNATREMFWDEDNRLMVLSDNGKTSRYTYNAGGERIIKSHGSMEGVYINGAPQGIIFHETDEFTLYPASILSVSKNRFTKHYFIGDKRIASRIGQGEFNNVYGSNGSNVTAGQRDYAERMNQIENQREDYYKAAGVAPGLPTMKGSYADPEVTGVGYNVLIKELGDHSVPENWVQRPVVNTEAGSNPGAPLAWGSPENPDDVVAGYGYVAADTSEVEETFYYHSDHLGSTAYITDQKANVTQYDAYLPYGELLVDEHSSSTEMPYKFNGKELDEETGLYYYGARYMNPVTSMWYGVDPLAEKFVSFGAYIYCKGNPLNLIDKFGERSEKPDSARKRVTVTFNIYESKWPNVYKNHVKGMKGKMVMDLTYDESRSNKIRRRHEATGGIPTQPLMDKDEFPYACTMEGGKGASVMLVPRYENRSHGGTLQSLIRGNKLETGDIIRVVLRPAQKQKEPRPVTAPSIKVPEPKTDPINPIVGGAVLGTLGVKIFEKSPVMTIFNFLCAPLKFENMFNEQMDDNVR
ncbi:MAG: SpvB/TcaC N-terminal domain-containing protein [Prevotellaceae bacterium]|nr:SpvB/TcaC N-terminal domain-containing protein [Prevotellaceae bacterium]